MQFGINGSNFSAMAEDGAIGQHEIYRNSGQGRGSAAIRNPVGRPPLNNRRPLNQPNLHCEEEKVPSLSDFGLTGTNIGVGAATSMTREDSFKGTGHMARGRSY